MIASRFFRAALILAASVAASSGLAATPALVVDVDSGKVLYAERATDPWFPASITKLMTTYVALDMVRQGRASMDQLLTVSPLAAAEPPSKMGFKPGTQVTLDNALKIIMVKSANDVSWTIAEGLGGSVEGFAAMMNDAARRIGMRESVWTNPNGLPDDRQYTSARDMAILGRALLRDFPERRDLFSISAIQFGRRVMANHNGLLGRYPGVDGMKTGFICSGGFNVVASATREGRRLITVVMGSPTARERTHKAADLFDRGFSLSSFGGQALEELPASTVAEPRNMRPIVCERHKPEPEEDAEIAAVTPGAAPQGIGANLFAAPSSALAFAGMNAASWQNRALPPRAPLQPILVWTGQDPAESRIAADAPEPATRVRGRRSKIANAQQAAPAKKRGLRARVDAAMDAAEAAPAPTPTIMEGLPKPATAKPATAKPAAAKPAAKPAAVASAPKPTVSRHGTIGASGEARATGSTKLGAIASNRAGQSKPASAAEKPANAASAAAAAPKAAVKKPVASASAAAPKTKTAVAAKTKPKAEE